MLKQVLVLVGVAMPLAFPVRARAENVEFKIATLAAKGSASAKILEKGAKEIAAQTSGRVKFKYYFSGQQGDERTVVSKMASGMLGGAALTGVGLGQINRDVRVLELPFMFANARELGNVRDAMKADFDAKFDAAGYVMLAWIDDGWTHLYTKNEVQSKAHLSLAKMWVQPGDQVVRSLFSLLGMNGVASEVGEVLSLLRTGTIDGLYGAPRVVVERRWSANVRFAIGTPISYGVGAVVLRKDVFAMLSAEDQKAVIAGGAAMGAAWLKVVRSDNERAKRAMEKSGVTFVVASKSFNTELRAVSEKVWKALVGTLYDQKLLDQVLKARAEGAKK